MAFFWWLVGPLLILLAIVSVIYLVRHKTTRRDVEQTYLADADRRAQAAHDPIDRSGF